MNKEFIPYEQALALKELGFESPYPIGGYQGGKVFYYEKGELYYDGRPMYSSDAHSGQLLAPLYQQAFRFFREKYKLQQIIWSGKISTVFYGYDILNIDEQEFIINNSENGGGECDYAIYEEAEQACLDKLIEIIKNK